MDPREAEVAAENYLKAQGYITRRAIRARFNKVDFFDCDVVGKGRKDTVYIQVTTSRNQSHIRERRRKLDAIPWLDTDRVLLFQVVERPSPVHAHRIERFFRVHEKLHGRNGDGWIVLDEAIRITGEMVRVRR